MQQAGERWSWEQDDPDERCGPAGPCEERVEDHERSRGRLSGRHDRSGGCLSDRGNRSGGCVPDREDRRPGRPGRLVEAPGAPEAPEALGAFEAPAPGPGTPVPAPGARAVRGPAYAGAEAEAAAEAEERRISYARSFLRALPGLLIVAGVCFDLFAPADYTAGPLFTAAPLVAAPLFSLRGTVLTGTAAVAVVLGVHLGLGVLGKAGEVTEVATVVTVAALAVLINVLVRRNVARLASARQIAEAAQRAVLPEPAARIGGLDIAARYEAAQADAFIGGDLYTVQDSPHGVRLVVGDVRGKGMGAVTAVAVLIGAFREAAEQEPTLEAVVQRLERALSRDRAGREGPDVYEGFTTAVLAEIPHGSGVVRIVNRGHPVPLLLLPDGSLRELQAREPALPLGMGDLGVWPDRAEEWDFPPGSTLLFHTDGVSEARDAHGRFYDPAVRLAGRVFPGPGALLSTVTREVARHTGRRGTDDMALLAVRRPAAHEPGHEE